MLCQEVGIILCGKPTRRLYIIAAVALHLEVLSVHFAIAKYMSKVALTKINM